MRTIKGGISINYLKTQAGLDIAERRRPQEGRWLFEDNGGRIDLRLNVVPTLFGEDIAVRILDRRFGLRALDAPGLAARRIATTRGPVGQPQRPDSRDRSHGTGKTTTLYACVQELNQRDAQDQYHRRPD